MADLSFTLNVSADDLADDLASEPETFLDLLSEMADGFNDRDLRRMQDAHCGSNSHQRVAPFLEKLAAALRAVEADMAKG